MGKNHYFTTYISLTILCLLSASCSDYTIKTASPAECVIYPDYKGVTIPVNIAPLNFHTTKMDKGFVRFEAGEDGENGYSFNTRIRRGEVTLKKSEWKKITSAAAGSHITVTVVTKEGGAFNPFNIYVTPESVDKYAAYRLIEPLYQNWNQMGIYLRDLENYKEMTILDNRNLDNACVNCHSFCDRDAEKMLFHIRKREYGGTYIRTGNDIKKLDTKTPETISALVYLSWHPGGNYVAFSVNNTKQMFHISDPNTVEVFDYASDVVVYDVRTDELVSSPLLKSKDSFETFPTFSPDGRTLYFCTADSTLMPDHFREVHYALCSISFDPETGRFGENADTLFRRKDKSVSFPRVSPDGKYLLFTLSDYGNFSIWHRESDLWLYNLDKKTDAVPASEWNSLNVDSFHSWSSDSHWVIFSSRRDDGLYTRLYLGYIDDQGRLGKPFLLPQKHPLENKSFMKSYNIPEFVSSPVKALGYQVRNAKKAEKVTFSSL